MNFKILCKGDFNQNSDVFPLLSRGKQCVSICVTFLLKTIILDVYDWIKKIIMKHGDEMYRKKYRIVYLQIVIIICTQVNYWKKFSLRRIIFVMNFKQNCCKLIVVYCARTLSGICHCFQLKMLYSVLIVAVDQHIIFCLLKAVPLAYFII